MCRANEANGDIRQTRPTSGIRHSSAQSELGSQADTPQATRARTAVRRVHTAESLQLGRKSKCAVPLGPAHCVSSVCGALVGGVRLLIGDADTSAAITMAPQTHTVVLGLTDLNCG